MAYGPDKQAVLQRLRPAVLQQAQREGGGVVDAVIAEQAGAGGKDDAPIDSLAIGTIALVGLFETDTRSGR